MPQFIYQSATALANLIREGKAGKFLGPFHGVPVTIKEPGNIPVSLVEYDAI